MIVPLSLTFSGQFRSLRGELEHYGSNWFSSYDNIPASVFSGVSQRCTIWIGQKRIDTQREDMTAPMRRWRADYRSYLMPTLAYAIYASGQAGLSEIPKFATAIQAKIYTLLKKSSNVPVTVHGPGKAKLGYSKSARNYITTFITEPPCLNADTLKLEPSAKVGWLSLSSQDEAFRYLALTSGDFYLWYWLVCGDGFDVTNWMVEGFLRKFVGASSPEFVLIAQLGELLHNRRIESLQFKKNAGKYVGSFNYRNLAPITRRSDLLAGVAIGLSRSDMVEIFDYIVRVLAINESAGEKAIPREVKQMFTPVPFDAMMQRNLFRLTDERIMEHYGFTVEELNFVLNHDMKYPV